MLSRRGLREQQVGNVCAGYQQEKANCTEKQEQRWTNSAGDRVVQRDGDCIFEEIIALLA